ncbi:MAG TPA: protein kinase [Pyrinomonadaceae bacterium]|nr:protein kinase [Pyrinomonadaceae bacterium]
MRLQTPNFRLDFLMIGTTLLNYRITEKLGAGGQGTVYKAIDERLGRTVVVKVLAPELMAREANVQRFVREAQLASSLDHPNICTIYGLHELDGLHVIAMQYIEGRNVRELVDGRPLPLASAVSIATQVADALSAAHARGIIHRDIKAGNVMVTNEGLAKVLDFGLAKLLDDAPGGSQTDIHLTEMGVPYGTATYAAPEQATGARVDHRADIFSTGVLLYEMLAGTWPFRGKTSVEVRYAVLHDTPQPISEARRDDPPESLQRILDRALAKNPDARYQTMRELRDDLRAARREVAQEAGAAPSAEDLGSELVPVARRQPSTGGVGRSFRRWLRSLTGAETQPTSLPPANIARTNTGTQASQPAASGGVSDRAETASQTAASPTPTASPRASQQDTQQQQHTSTFGHGSQKSIAILPFRNLQNDAEAAFYEFSLADAVITELARQRSLVVRPSSMIVKYQGKQFDPLEAGRELKVSAVLSASFLRVGAHLRVNVQLLDVESGDLLWSDRIDAAAEDIIALQDTIARRIVDGLQIEHTSVESSSSVPSRPSSAPTTNAAAYEEYLRGRDFFGRYIFRTLEAADCERAIAHFERAVSLDPSFALAYSGLGACYANRVIKGAGAAEDYERAEEAFDRALSLDPEVVEARMLMVFIHLARGEKQRAREEVARLQQKAPNQAAVYFVSGALHRLDGEYELALRSFARLAQLDPAARVVVSYNRARIFMYLGRYDEALLELDLGAEVEPNHPLIRTFRAVVLNRRGETHEAIRVIREVLDTHPRMDGIRPILAHFLSRTGEHEAARAELENERVKEAAAVDHDIAYWLASGYALEGMRDEAFEWLERAIKLGNENRPWFEKDGNWEALRTDARFRELMDSIGARRSTETEKEGRARARTESL